MIYREITYDINIVDEMKNNMIKVDDSRLSIILYNLFSNSVKHTTDGKITVSANVIGEVELKELIRIQKKRNFQK